MSRISDGPPGLYPDPAMMAIAACDDDFRDAIRNAWEIKKIPGQTILWSIDAGTNDAFHGDSVGAAFALAFDELNRRMGRLGRVRYRHADDSYVISAALDGTGGGLCRVNGLPEKFEEAARAGKKHVVLAEQNRSEGEAQARQWSVQADCAKDVDAAITITRRLNPMFAVTLAATVFTLLVLGAGGTFAAYKIVGADRQTNIGKLLSTVSNLERLAQQTGTSSLPDMQAKAQDLLTAHALAVDAGRPDLADQIAESNIRSSAGIQQTLNADLGGIQGLYTVGQNTVATSDKGKIALIDSSTLDALGTYTLPPGTETLNQWTVKALAVAPHAYNFAAVSQVPVAVAGVSARATLEIFSAAGKLTLVGRSSGFTHDQVRELSYSPGGDKLIAITATEAYFWDVSNATPQLLGRCALPRRAGAVPVAVFPDPKSKHPLIVQSNSRILSLPSWSQYGTAGACETAQVTPPWAGKLAALDKSELTPPTITAGAASQVGAMVAAITTSGRVKIRLLATGRVMTLPSRAPATHVAGPYGDYVAVQVKISHGTAIQLWNWNVDSGSKPVLEAAYPGLALPGTFADGPLRDLLVRARHRCPHRADHELSDRTDHTGPQLLGRHRRRPEFLRRRRYSFHRRLQLLSTQAAGLPVDA